MIITKNLNRKYNHYENRQKIKESGVILEESLFKELLAFSDILFHKLNRNNEAYNKNELEGYSPEEITEGISYIIFLYDEIVGISKIKNPFVVSDFVVSKEIKNLLLLSCKIQQLQEWELCVDYFGYEVNKIDRTYNIYTKDDLFEKSVRLGYIRTMMQGAIFYSKGFDKQKETPGLIEMSKYFNDSGISCVVETGKGLLSRYRFNLPEPLLDIFTNKTLFKEELIDVAHFAHEMIMPLDDLLTKKITDNCTIYDLILFKRFFVILDLIAENQIFSQKNPNKIIASILPNFNKDKLADILSKFVGDISKSYELLELFTYKKDVKLDLQYTPFLSSGNNIFVPIALVAKSNFLRNCIAYSYLLKNEIVNQSDEEHLVMECKRVFEENHTEYKVLTNKKFLYQNQHGEIDVLAISEHEIYIIECKAPLEPTGNFELRASFDHIHKAAKQLDNSKKAFLDEAFLRNFLKNIGVEYKPRSIHTCVMMGNRFFNGYMISSHPVRYIRELDMILNNGHIYSEIGNWRVWKENEFCNLDLMKFFSNNYTISNINFKSMKPWRDQLHIDGKKVVFDTYIFDTLETIKQYDSIFIIEERNEEKLKLFKKQFGVNVE